MPTNTISIQIWTPSTPEITVEAYSTDGNGIQTGNDDTARLQVQDTTVAGSLVLNGRSDQPLVLQIVSVEDQDTIGNLDELRIYQLNGEQVFFRYNGYVSSNDLGMNRTATGTAQTWGTSTRRRFEAPAIAEFGPEWWRLASADNHYELDLTIREIP